METAFRFCPAWLRFGVMAFVLLGIGLRLFNITQSDFVFYDEGYYFHYNKTFTDLVARHFPESFTELKDALFATLRISLGSGKALWIFLINLRVFLGLDTAWFYPRVISALAGCLTLFVVYRFAKDYYRSTTVAALSTIFLAVLPSHVFYSRLAMQEGLCTLWFVLGFYFYVIPKKLQAKTFLSSLFFMLAYYSNYRLVILPFLVLMAELYLSFSEGRCPDWRKYVWHTIGFLGLVVPIASIGGGEHFIIIVPWMLHQGQLAQGEPFHWYNFLSYPVYTFLLESLFFGVLFWGNLYNALRQKGRGLFLFFMVGLQMAIFSLVEDKAARYICVVTPFMAIAAAGLAVGLFEKTQSKEKRAAVAVFVVLAVVTLTVKSFTIASFKSDYRSAMDYLKARDPAPKILASQKWVLNLYSPPSGNVEEVPRRYPAFLNRVSAGFKYLVLDPQAYVSWGEDEKRFNPQLTDYLGFVNEHIQPVKVFPHLNKSMLTRFVFEHNTDLKQSFVFLKEADRGLGTIRIYDAKAAAVTVLKAVAGQQK